jgi:hypothetical protein
VPPSSGPAILFILGLPGETKGSIRNAIRLAKQLDCETIQVSVAHAFPGTELFDFVEKMVSSLIRRWQTATAIQQGQRLDWWRSGVFNALFWTGAFLTICALIRRFCGPNPLIALPYLWRWNTVLLGVLLFCFRFTLRSTIILIPQSLAIQGFEADQIGLL